MDIKYLLLLQNFRETIGGALNGFLTFITNVAVNYYILIPALIIFWVIDKRKGIKVLMTWGLASIVNAFFKVMFCVYRPWIRSKELKPLESALSQATGYSFPSGHSSSAASFYAGLIASFKKNKGLVIFSVIMILLTMFSRNYVGVHTPQDVLVGMLIGITSAFLIAKLFDFLDGHPYLDWLVVIIAIILSATAIIFIILKKYPIDIVDGVILVDPSKMTIDGFKDPGRFFGIFIAFFIEERFINFDNTGSKSQKLVRCLFGALLVIAYWTIVCDWLGNYIGVNWVNFLLQASCPIVFIDLYPILFNKIL